MAAQLDNLTYLIDISIEQYTGMIEILCRLNNDFGNTSSEALTNFFKRYKIIGNETQKTDILLHAELKKIAEEEVRRCLGKKLYVLQTLQAELKVEIGKSVSLASKVKSLLAHEMGGVVKGRAAMQGYRSHSTNQGRILRRSY